MQDTENKVTKLFFQDTQIYHAGFLEIEDH